MRRPGESIDDYLVLINIYVYNMYSLVNNEMNGSKKMEL